MSGSRAGRQTARRVLSILASVGLLAGLLAATTGTVGAAGPAGGLTCSGGDLSTFSPQMIPSGTYTSLTVTGFCEVAPGATITVKSGLTVAPGAILVASAAFDGQCDRTIRVSGGVGVGAFGSLLLGDGPGSGCVPNTQTTVNGGLNADRPLNLIVHGVTVNGGITSIGGGDGSPCDFGAPTGPTYSTIEDSQVNGGVTVSGYQACWLGFARNQVEGGVTFTNNVLDDPDAMEILSNTINGGLACSGNVPTATNILDAHPTPPPNIVEANTVHGAETGQCVGL